MRALMVRYRLGNLFVCKHKLLLSKCPLTADWLLIRPVWNEISNEALNYNPIPEHIISHTYCMPLSVSQCFIYFCQLFYSTRFIYFFLLCYHSLYQASYFMTSLCFPSHRVQLQREIWRVYVRLGAVQEYRQWGALCELQRPHWWTPLWALQRKLLQRIPRRALPSLQLQYQRLAAIYKRLIGLKMVWSLSLIICCFATKWLEWLVTPHTHVGVCVWQGGKLATPIIWGIYVF